MPLPPYWGTLPDPITRQAAAGLTWRRIEATDGYMLNCYEMGRGNRDKLVLLNALGLPFALLMTLGLALADRFHVIGWDTRGSPEINSPFESRFASVDFQSDDLLRINDHFGGDIQSAVTWSSGAFVLFKAMQKGFASCRHRVLLAPSDIGNDENKTPFLDYFKPLFIKAADGELSDLARLRRHITAALNLKEDIPARTLNVAYARDNEGTRRYANYFKAALDFRDEARSLYNELSRDNDFLIVHAMDDVFSDPSGSLQALKNGPRTRLMLYNRGGHFLMYERPAEVAHDIASCIEGQSRLAR